MTATRPRYGLTTTIAPAAEPVTTAEAKAHLRVDHTDDDTYIGTLITAAREYAEALLNRTLIERTLLMTLDAFPQTIEVPMPPMQATEPTITYLDANGDSQTLASSKVRINRALEPAIITPADGETWPGTQDVTGAVTVLYSAGYGSAGSSVPSPIVHAIKLIVGEYYDNTRTETIIGTIITEIPVAAARLLWPYRIVPT